LKSLLNFKDRIEIPFEIPVEPPLFQVALRCPFHRRTLAHLGVGVVAERVLADGALPVGEPYQVS
jgi:hypothetical protein